MRTALGFMTRIPVRDTRPLTTERLSRAAFWFPAVGVIVGAVMGGTYLLAELVLPQPTAIVLALLAAILMTGGFHEDGLADSADAMGAHVSRERKLEILRDSRIGTFGGLALVLALLFAFSALVGMEDDEVVRAAIAGHVLGRWSGLPQSLWLPQARPEGAGTLVEASLARTLLATAYAVAIVLLVAGPAAGAIACATAVVVTAIGALVAVRTFGGVSGDTFGAVNKLVELSTYAALAGAYAG